MQRVAHWLRHTPMTEPGALALEFEKLPSDVASLNRLAQGLLVHSEWLSAYGVDASALRSANRVTLPVSERLGELLRLDKRGLHVARAPANRSAGTCRDFALTLCSFFVLQALQPGYAAVSRLISLRDGKTTGFASIGTDKEETGGLAILNWTSSRAFNARSVSIPPMCRETSS